MKHIHAFLLLSACLLVSCGEDIKKVAKQANPITIGAGVVLPFNTSINLTLYLQSEMDKQYDNFNNEITRLHKLFDRHNEYAGINNLSVINDLYNSGNTVKVDDDLFELLTIALDMCELTEGNFNPFIGNIVSYWETCWSAYSGATINDLSSEEMSDYLSSIPQYTEIRNILELDETNKTVKFNEIPNSEMNGCISLGGIAKGYAIDKVSNELDNTKPYLLSGGSSSIVINGDNPMRDSGYFNIGLTDPNSVFGASLFVNQYKGKNVLSISGDYENYCFNENGIRRHHILNPNTGFSENYYRTMGVRSDSRADILDALSTALYNISSDTEILRITKKVEDFYNIDINVYYLTENDGQIVVHGDAESKSHMLLNDTLESSFVLIGENE